MSRFNVISSYMANVHAWMDCITNKTGIDRFYQYQGQDSTLQNHFQSANSSNNGGGGNMNLVSLVGTNGTRRPPSQQSSFHSSKNHSRHQSASAPPSTPRNVCQTEIEAPCIRKLVYCDVRLSLLEISRIMYLIR